MTSKTFKILSKSLFLGVHWSDGKVSLEETFQRRGRYEPDFFVQIEISSLAFINWTAGWVFYGGAFPEASINHRVVYGLLPQSRSVQALVPRLGKNDRVIPSFGEGAAKTALFGIWKIQCRLFQKYKRCCCLIFKPVVGVIK